MGGLFNGVFGKKKTQKEIMRGYQRAVNKTVRELDRERVKMEQQEKKLIIQMKKTAKQNQIEAVKIMAKDLVRTRKYITKFHRMRATMQAVGLRLQTLRSTQAMTDAMKGTAKAMVAMNRNMDIPAMQRVMGQFTKQNEIMEMKEEFMNEAIDDAFEDEEDEDEENSLIAQVLDQLDLDLDGKLGTTPKTKLATQEQAVDKDQEDLQARLANLKK